MANNLLVVFGKPGAGKSYVAQILSNSFGYYCHDGDSDLPKRMRDTLFRKEIITEAMRKEFVANMIVSIKKLVTQHKTLVIHQTFLKEYMRKQFLDAFPHAKFLLVETPVVIREKRYMERKYFNLGLSYLRHMSLLFEDVHIPHHTIINAKDGTHDIIPQLSSLIVPP